MKDYPPQAYFIARMVEHLGFFLGDWGQATPEERAALLANLNDAQRAKLREVVKACRESPAPKRSRRAKVAHAEG